MKLTVAMRVNIYCIQVAENEVLWRTVVNTSKNVVV